MRLPPAVPFAAALAAVAAAPGWGATAFDNFGPGDAFDTGAAALIGPGPTGTVELGFAFTAAASGGITALTAPFTSSAPPSSVNLNLYGWNGVAPGPLIDTSPVRVGNPQTAPGLVVADQWQASLTAGTQYLMTASADTPALWWTALNSASGTMIYFLDGVRGEIDGAAVAARVEVGLAEPAPIPLPGALPLILGGLLALALAARRRHA